MESLINKGIKLVKKFAIFVIGFTMLLIGIVMIILPGPAFIVIPIGLGILATEFLWARRLLKKVKNKLHLNSAKTTYKKAKKGIILKEL